MRLEAGVRLRRIFGRGFPDPLGFAKTPSRFSDPRHLPEAERYGVLYLGDGAKVCFLEAVLRDRRDGVVGGVEIEERELIARSIATVTVRAPLALVDLRVDGAVRMGVPSDVVRGSDQLPARDWALALHEHPSRPDGIAYPSRLNAQTNVAVFERAIHKLEVSSVTPLLDDREIADMLDVFEIALVPDGAGA
ncbi:RES family NAD+ phosphorylase [Salinarimonas chemoclinalis]|uniref:RES family NAD+ phosphorylase n=1 Tax=Salinarimonas chemoclinalis TaxID=3241599 RepID=UPI00355653E7